MAPPGHGTRVAAAPSEGRRQPADPLQAAVAALVDIAQLGTDLDLSIGEAVRAADAAGRPDGEGVAARVLFDRARTDLRAGEAVAALQVALDALGAAAPGVRAKAMAIGGLDEAARAALLRHRSAALAAVLWLPVLRDPRTGRTDAPTPALRVWHALPWGLSAGEARRWTARARLAGTGRAEPQPQGADGRAAAGGRRPPASPRS